MRTVALFISLLLCALAMNAEDAVSWLQKTHDFGTFKEENGKVSCDIKMINSGDSVIRITNVRPTCGCTATQYTIGDIAPGDTATITVTYNPYLRPGRFEKDVYVYINGSPRRHTLTIKGNVIGSAKTISEKYPVSAGALKLSNRILPFGELKKGKSRTQFIAAYNQSEDSLKALFSQVPGYLQVEMIPEIVPPGEQATITVTYHSNEDSQWGLSQNSFIIETFPIGSLSENAVAGIANIEVSAILNEDFSKVDTSVAPVAKLSTHKVDFDKIDATQTNVTSSLDITNNGKSSLKIRRVYSLDKGVSVSCKKTEVKPGKSTQIKIAISPKELDNILNAKLTIITNDSENPQQTVRLVGIIVK